MGKNSLLNTIWICIEALLLATLGILTIVYARNIDAWNVIGYISGTLILIDGLLRLLLYVLARSINPSKVDLIRGIIETSFGVFLLIRPEIVVTYFTLYIAIAMVVIGFICFIECIVSNIRSNPDKWSLIGYYIFSIAVLALGIVALVYYPYDLNNINGNNTISILLIVIGVLFIVLSVLLVILALYRKRKEAKAIKESDEKIAEQRSQKRKSKLEK